MDDQPKRIHAEDTPPSKSGSDKASSMKNADNDNSNNNSNEDVDVDVDVSESILQQTRQRNAIYSKRKYYKKKHFVEQLKVKKVQLESSNKQLRSDNARLETLIRQAKQRHQLLLQQQATAAVGTMTPSNTAMTSLLSIPKPRGSTLAQLMTSDSSSHNRPSTSDDLLSLCQSNTYTTDLCSLQSLLPHQRNLCDNDWRLGATMNDVYESSLVRERNRANAALSVAYASHNDLATLSTQRPSIQELTKMLSTTTKPNVSSLDLYRNQQNDDNMIRNASQALAIQNMIDHQNRSLMPNVESIIGIPTTTSASSSSLYSMQRDQGMNYNSRYYSTLLSNIATNGLHTATSNTMYPPLSLLSTQQQQQQQDQGDTNLTLLQMLLRHQSEQR